MSGDIKFGTDGWRGVIALDFTFENVRKVAKAVVAYLKSDKRERLKMYSEWKAPLRGPEKGVVVGYDRRFMSDKFAKAFADEVSKCGVPVFLSKEPVPTPAVSYGVLRREAALGIMITASHNPPEYNGIKLKPEYGGPALPEVTSLVESLLDTDVKISFPASVEIIDMKGDYVESLKRGVSLELLKRLHIKVMIDPMYGSGTGVLSGILKSLGLDVEEIHTELNPYFGGIHPEPIPPYTNELSQRVREAGENIGIVLDGDADRIGIVDEEGNFVNPHQVFALLMKHLIEDRGKRGSVVWTCSLGREPEKLAQKYKIEHHITPVGFKHICEYILQDGVLLGGEESGGFGFVEHLPERDGSMSALLLLEMMAKRQKGVRELLNELYEDFGPYYYRRIDLKLEKKLSPEELEKLVERITSALGEKPMKIDRIDGVKLHFFDESWLLVRPSGTEPLLRLYSQAPSQDRLESLLSKAKEVALNA
ncbi:MAG: phosphoglucomutase/phosphomannomutase family protein [Synergistetes bacterium]|nr:phosphoglucomutase/phosphomannomutase family protein [Synergistota bacterium]